MVGSVNGPPAGGFDRRVFAEARAMAIKVRDYIASLPAWEQERIKAHAERLEQIESKRLKRTATWLRKIEAYLLVIVAILAVAAAVWLGLLLRAWISSH
jgi:hypothetical protein